MKNHFYAYISRLKLISRWGLMRSSIKENDAEHSLQTAFIAHGIAIIGREKYGRDCNPDHILALAAYHDAAEVITGDMPTPVKYQSETLRSAYKQVETSAVARLSSMMSSPLKEQITPYLAGGEGYDQQVVKAADRISAYTKCIEEETAGNREFISAGENLLAAIKECPLPEVREFLEEYVPSFRLTLDEMNK